LAVLTARIDPIYSPSSEPDSQCDREVYMVEYCGELLENIIKDIQWEADEEIAHVERLTSELDKRKGHNDFQDDSLGLEDEHRDGPPSRRHHLKFDS
jgi:hypothetical protein